MSRLTLYVGFLSTYTRWRDTSFLLSLRIINLEYLDSGVFNTDYNRFLFEQHNYSLGNIVYGCLCLVFTVYLCQECSLLSSLSLPPSVSFEF